MGTVLLVLEQFQACLLKKYSNIIRKHNKEINTHHLKIVKNYANAGRL